MSAGDQHYHERRTNESVRPRDERHYRPVLCHAASLEGTGRAGHPQQSYITRTAG
jgi:hypothetical protein